MVDENLVHDLGHELSPGATDIMTYSLSPYGGKLNPGHYRIACCDIGIRKISITQNLMLWLMVCISLRLLNLR